LVLPTKLVAQTIATFAGNGMQGYGGDSQQAINASIGFPGGITFSKTGDCFFTENNNTIRKVSATGIISTIAGNGTQGFGGDGNVATAAQLHGPSHIAVDNSGDIFFTDFYNNRIRKIDATTGVITTIAGNTTGGFGGDSGLAILATLYSPNGIVFDDIGNLYFSDYGNHRIRRIDIAGTIATIAGNGGLVDSGDGGLAIYASILAPQGIAVVNHKLYIADSKRIRMVDLNTGIITSIAGDGTFGYSGDGGPADSAKFLLASDVAIYGSSYLYITDQSNNRVRVVDLNTNVINTAVGNGVAGYNGDGGLADTSELNSPRGIALDSCGNLYIVDNGNHRIRKVTFNPACSPESVNELNNTSSISIYPNPAKEQLTITGNKDVKYITILNTLGQVLVEQNSYNSDKAVINVSNLGSGVYFIKVSDKNGNVATKRFVKE